MKCSLSDIEGLSAQIENLGNLGREQLDQAWRDLFESGRPRRVCGDLLIKALGYRLQEKAIGGLKPSTRRLLERWGRNGSERGPSAEPARTRLKAGTVLVREWHGVTHRVTVLDDGFDFDGERFRSLSEIARKIRPQPFKVLRCRVARVGSYGEQRSISTGPHAVPISRLYACLICPAKVLDQLFFCGTCPCLRLLLGLLLVHAFINVATFSPDREEPPRTASFTIAFEVKLLTVCPFLDL